MSSKEMNPCYGCSKRTVGCHSSCEDYKRYLKEYKDKKVSIKRYLESDTSYRDYNTEKIARLQKFKREHKK